MRIAQVSPIIERVPPKKYGGIERVVFALTEELIKKGHRLTLFASGDSITKARLLSVYPISLREAHFKDIYGMNSLCLLNIGSAYKMQNEFDIIHEHNSYIALPTANLSKTPVVVTAHGPFTPEIKRIFFNLKKPHLVTISKSQGKYAYGLNHIGTVYNGLNLEDFPFSKKHEGYLLFIGRICMDKGIHFAIETAMHLNLKLIIGAKLEECDMPYFLKYVKPYLSNKIKWIGEVDEQKRNQLMSRAMCFLHPANWQEPFGLVMIEAMACGCPVIAFNKGSIPEIVKNGKTGFVVSDIVEMVDAVLKVDKIDRLKCRQYVLKNFSAKKMADEYEKIYQKIINGNRKNLIAIKKVNAKSLFKKS
ncbi:glycosyltransferase family 4 protein [Candidatus Parcubacteria bacterium]|nr:MAG: glycosyltransferase family 4 protein [Candidatus Parcubacteria bacterium]